MLIFSVGHFIREKKHQNHEYNFVKTVYNKNILLMAGDNG